MSATLNAIVISGGLLMAFAHLPAGAENAVITAPTEINPGDFNTASGNNCTNGEIIDGSTAEQALAKFRANGYSDVKILEKGCDNFWHATGVKGGQAGNIVLSPDGMVMPEGN